MRPLLSDKQRAYWREATHRWNLKTGATRSGKTYMDMYLLPKRLLDGAGKEGLNVMIGNTRGTLQRNVIEPMRALYGAGRVGDVRADGTVDMFGQRVYTFGADTQAGVDRLRGASVKYAYGDEVGTWSENLFHMLKSRMDRPYSLFDGTCNPEGPDHWLYAFLNSGADVYAQTYTLDDNPYLDPAVVASLKREYAGTVLYDRYIMGLWVSAEGALFTTCPEADADPEVLRDGVAHVDAAYGGADGTALTLGRREGGTLYLYGRLWQAHVDTALDAIVGLCRSMRCAPVLCERNADRGYLARELRRRGAEARTYFEKLNKHTKIGAYLRKWWSGVRFVKGTDRAYISQILSYTEGAAHDDAPDSAACVARYFDGRAARPYRSLFL